MGQKSNVLTLRTNLKKNLSFVNQNNESREFLCGFEYLKILEKLFNKKNVLLINSELNLVHSSYRLNINLFFRTPKLTRYKKKTINHLRFSKKLKSNLGFFLNSNKLFKIFVPKRLIKKKSIVLLKIKVVNCFINNFLLKQFYQKTSRFTNILFVRKFTLFIDFLKISALLYEKKVSVNTFIFILSQIFKVLPKNKHSRFLFFLKQVFQMLIQDSKHCMIKGIKFLINGKLRGKTRGSSSCIQIGMVPIQSIDKNIEFSKAHVYTLYGAFGFKIWLYREQNN
jgi:hypothetical protein